MSEFGIRKSAQAGSSFWNERGASAVGIITALIGLIAAGLGLVEALYRTEVIHGRSPVERVVGNGNGNGNGNGDAPTNDKLPFIEGVPLVGSTLVANEGDWDPEPDDFDYRWLRCLDDDCSPIEGAISKTFLVTEEDLDQTISVEVTASNETGSNAEISEPTGTIESSPTPAASPTE